MGNTLDGDFVAKLRHLSERFASSVPATLEQLQAARMAFCLAEPEAANLKELMRILHTVAGSAPSFGYTQLGKQARLLEQVLRILSSGSYKNDNAWIEWLYNLDQLLLWAARDPKASDYV